MWICKPCNPDEGEDLCVTVVYGQPHPTEHKILMLLDRGVRDVESVYVIAGPVVVELCELLRAGYIEWPGRTLVITEDGRMRLAALDRT